MNPVPELAPQLKQLRLSGILDSLEARNRQAIDAKLAYTEFLALLIGDEVARREQKKFSLRLRRAQFRTTKTLEQFDFERLPQLNRALVHDLATGRYLQEKAPVLIVGPCGTGKSHLAQALGHCAVRQGIDVVFTTCASLTQSLNAARATGGYERKLATLARVPLLIIDDFGLKPLRAPADEDLHDLIAERYEQAATVSVQPSHLDRGEPARDDGAHQFEQVGTYAIQFQTARARRRVQGPGSGRMRRARRIGRGRRAGAWPERQSPAQMVGRPRHQAHRSAGTEVSGARTARS